jgi:subtilisin family serine protease
MSTRKNARLALCSLACAISYAHALPNDLLIHEQWGLNNVPRSSSNTPLSVSATQYSSIGTCAEKPAIAQDDYSCPSFTTTGVEDIDINWPEGWMVYSPSPTLTQNEVVIALIDTGIDYGHPDLAGKIWLNPGEATGQDSNNNGIDDGCEDAIDGDNNGYLNDCHGINAMVDPVNANGSLNPIAGDPIDDLVGHGTNMAGVMAAIGNNKNGIYHGGVAGVAGIEPHIKIASCKSAKIESDIFPLVPGVATAVAAESAILRCLDYFRDLKQRGINIAVINASGGMSKHVNYYHLMYPLVREKYWLNTPAMYLRADLLEQDDIVVVAAAGNFSWNIDVNPVERAYFPAAFSNENIISVGAINNQGQLWSGSSYGRWSVDVFAPGQRILSTNPRYPLVNETAADFVVSDGTSQATAYVAGMVALLRANANTAHLDAKSIRRLLLSSGMPLSTTHTKSVAGSLVRLADSNGRGALTCDQQVFKRRQQPQADTSMVALPGETISIEVQNFVCANPGSESSLAATIMPTGQTITLLDDGSGTDRVAGDGIYSATWTVPHGHFEYSLSTGWDSVKKAEDVLTIQAGIIVDNDTAATDQLGNWVPSIYRAGYYGSLYRYATPSESEKRYTWSPFVNQTGYYRAYARWPQSVNFASNANFLVHHRDPSDGSAQVTSVFMDQTRNGRQWMDMGVYWLEAGTNTIELTNINANGSSVADAVMLVPEP